MAKKKSKLRNVASKSAKGYKGFITPVGSPMGQYMKYGDFNPSEVGKGTLTWTETETDRGRSRVVTRTMKESDVGVTIQDFANRAKRNNPNVKAVRFGGKLYKIGDYFARRDSYQYSEQKV